MTNVQKHPFWQVLKAALQNDLDSKVFIFASVFGGTGASGYPVISQLLKMASKTSRIGGALLLPYFKLPDPKNLINQINNLEQEKVLPDSNSFMINAKAACEFYQNNFSGIDSNYVLGDDLDNCMQYENYSIGSKDQKNDAHMIEMIAAYAAVDFWEKTEDNYKTFYQIQVNNPTDSEPSSTDIIAKDIPHIKKGLIFERFSLLFHYVKELYDQMDKSNSNLLDKVAWLRDLKYRGNDVVRDRNEIKPLIEFCDSFKNWIHQTHTNRARLDILDPELVLTCLVSQNKEDYTKPPINHIDTKLCGKHRSKSNLSEALLKALSLAKIEKRGN